ncbi:MAG: TetR/AcrR family transcriptional regulator [Clostridiaceae bacterium]
MSKRSDILAATLHLIVEEGIQAVTLAKILKKADVGSGTLYNYFSSKDDLIRALYEEILQKMDELLLINYDATESVRLRFDRLAYNFLEYSIEYFDELNFVEQYEYMLNKTCQCDDTDCNLFFSAVIDLLIEGQKQLIIKSIDLSILCQIILGIIISVAKGFNGNKFELDNTKKREVINACWNSIRE